MEAMRQKKTISELAEVVLDRALPRFVVERTA
jgi:hypothetical protein